MFGAAVGLGVLFCLFTELVVGCPEYMVAASSAGLVVIFFLLHHLFTAIFQDSPTLPDFVQRRQKADQLYLQSRFSEAFDLYSELASEALVSASRNDRIELLVRFAMTAKALGAWAVTVSILEQALNIAEALDHRVYRFLLYRLGEAHFQLGHWPRATSLFKDFLATHDRLDSKKIESLLYLYQSYWKIDDFEKAQACREEALELLYRLPDLRIKYLEDARLIFGLSSG